MGDRRLLHPDRLHQLADRVRTLRRWLRIRTRLGAESANIASATASAVAGESGRPLREPRLTSDPL